MKVHINSKPNKNLMVLIHKNWLWRVYATWWVGLGLWGRCVSYVCENCVSYAHQKIVYHMHAKTVFKCTQNTFVSYCIYTKNVKYTHIFACQYHKFLFLIWHNIYMHFHETGLYNTHFSLNSLKISILQVQQQVITTQFLPMVEMTMCNGVNFSKR